MKTRRIIARRRPANSEPVRKWAMQGESRSGMQHTSEVVYPEQLLEMLLCVGDSSEECAEIRRTNLGEFTFEDMRSWVYVWLEEWADDEDFDRYSW